jgi:hypothetical protein
MTDQLSGCEADKVLDTPLRTIVGCLAEVLPKGPSANGALLGRWSLHSRRSFHL